MIKYLNLANHQIHVNIYVNMSPLKDSTKTAPVTMKMDPKGFYVYWTNQSKVNANIYIFLTYMYAYIYIYVYIYL